MKVRVLWVLLLVRKLEGSKMGLERMGWKGLVALCEFCVTSPTCKARLESSPPSAPSASPGSAGRRLWIPTPLAASCSLLLPTRRPQRVAMSAALRGKNAKHLGTGRESLESSWSQAM